MDVALQDQVQLSAEVGFDLSAQAAHRSVALSQDGGLIDQLAA
ncbi:MAG: hypothetical protein VX438_03545 [Planctomycetota bacterium]|nr:hypothetical protein [Planctomycetota bacterium]